MSPYVVRSIAAADHLGFIEARGSASFLQTPAWGAVKSEWRSESVGWFRTDDADPTGDGELVGVALVLYRRLPRLRRYLAYLPEGPVLDWSSADIGTRLDALTTYLRGQQAFAIRMGPPVVTRRWSSASIKAAIADDGVQRLGDVPADVEEPSGLALTRRLTSAGWTSLATGSGFSAGQPQHVFQLPLAGRTADEVLAGMNQLWRRNIKKAAKSGVEVTRATTEDLPAFHRLYVETARRDGFTPRPLGYFQQMFTAMLTEDPDRIRLYLAHHEGDLVAATTWVRVGTHTWYSYGASSTAKREVRGSNAIQWQMITDAIDAGAAVYDLRGITDTLAADDPHLGLIQFKVGTGGEAVEYVGEWDKPLNALLYRAFSLYMKRR